MMDRNTASGKKTINDDTVPFGTYSYHMNTRRLFWMFPLGMFGSALFFLAGLLGGNSDPAPSGQPESFFLYTLIVYFGVSLVFFVVLMLLNNRKGSGKDYSSSIAGRSFYYLILISITAIPMHLIGYNSLKMSIDTAYVFISLFYAVLLYLSVQEIILLHSLGLAINLYRVLLFSGSYRTPGGYLVFAIIMGTGFSLFLSLLLYSERKKAYFALCSFLDQRRMNFESLNEKFNLTERESDVIALLMEGHSYRKIADKLIISEHTVKSHIKNIYAKTGANGKMELLQLATRYSPEGKE